jgi:hypothetical protein
MKIACSILLGVGLLLAVLLAIPGAVAALDTPIEKGYDAPERPQFLLTSNPRVTTVPGVFEITNSMKALIKDDSIKDARVYSFDTEWISASLRGPICPDRGQVAPSQQKPIERPCNPIEGRVKAIFSFFAVDPSDFGVGYGFKVEPLLVEQQPVKKLSGLSGAPAYMPIHRVVGVIPAGMMPKFYSNPGHAPAEKLEVISQLSIGGFKDGEITGDIVKDNAVFQARSTVTRSRTGIYTYTYEVVTDHKRGVAFNWTSVRTPGLDGWREYLPKEPVLRHEFKDRSEAPLLVNDPAFVSFGKSPKAVGEVRALAILGFPIPPAVKKDVPLKTLDFHKGRDNASGEMQLGETTVAAVFRYLRSVPRDVIDYMVLAPAFVPDTYGSTK